MAVGIVNYGPSDEGGIGTPIATTTGTGAAYVATVEGITSLTPGLMITIIPHVVSTSTKPTLNVNGLGVKGIRRNISNSTSTAGEGGKSASWLAANKPVLLMYDGTYWITVNKDRVDVTDLFGVVEVNHGGTGFHSVNGDQVICSVKVGDYQGLTELMPPDTDSGVLMSGNIGGPFWADGSTFGRVEIGEYIGTGGYGTGPNGYDVQLSLTFDPILVIVVRYNSPARALILIKNNSVGSGWPQTTDDIYSYWGDHFVGWNSNANAEEMMNVAGVKYSYISIGR